MIINNQKGLATASAILIFGISVGVSYFLINKTDLIISNSARVKKDVRIGVIEEKLIRMGGFLIANNLIVCRKDPWINGNPGKSCGWSEINYKSSDEENQRKYTPEEFGLKKSVGPQRENRDYAKFFISKKEIFTSTKSLIIPEESWISFQLLHRDEIKAKIGSTLQIKGDSEEHFIVIEGKIVTREKGKKTRKHLFKAAFQRPMAVPHVVITSSSCTQRCNTALTENPRPACRTDFYIGEKEKTNLELKVKNLGPGAIYDLKFKRKVSLIDNSVDFDGTGLTPMPPVFYKNVDNYWLPGHVTKEISDNIPCAKITETRVGHRKNQRPQREGQLLPRPFSTQDYPSEFLAQTFNSLFPKAYAQQAQQRVRRTERSQHTNPMGTITYSIDDDGRNIEPSRVTRPLTSAPQEFRGAKEIIYTAPPH